MVLYDTSNYSDKVVELLKELFLKGFKVQYCSLFDHVKQFIASQKPVVDERKIILVSTDEDSKKVFEELEVDSDDLVISAFVYCFDQNTLEKQ